MHLCVLAYTPVVYVVHIVLICLIKQQYEVLSPTHYIPNDAHFIHITYRASVITYILYSYAQTCILF